MSRNTVRRHLRKAPSTPRYSARPERPSKLDPYKPYLLERIEAAKPHWIPASVLFREIKDSGYSGGISILRNFVRPFKVKQPETVVRFETEPGVQMQVDFTTIRRGRQTLKAFVATLGFSRASFVRFTQSERQDDWLEGIEAAFHFFGGVPKEILFDNAKCIMIQRNAYGDGRHQWNKSLLEQASTYGYVPRACKPYRARTKGKVERFNYYLKQSFITPLATTLRQAGLELTVEAANAHIGPWLAGVAHQRVHGTTGQQPQVRLEQERPALQSLPVVVMQVDKVVSMHRTTPPPVESLQHPLGVYDQLLRASL